MKIKSFLQQNYQKITLALLLLTQPFSATAIPKRNISEMVAAFTTMALEIAHKHYEFQDNSRRAEVLGLLAATSSLANKGLFLYNNHKAKDGLGKWEPLARDCLVNATWGVCDLAHFSDHLSEVLIESIYPTIQDTLPVNLNGTETPEEILTLLSNPAKASAPIVDKKSNLIYARDVIIFPVLKGLASFAMACTQGHTTSYSSDQARFTASSAYSFIRILEENINLPTNSALSKPLIAAALANFLWLGYELHQYELECQAVRGRTHHGQCDRCNNGKQQTLRVLECGHECCRNCLKGIVEFHKNHHPDQMHHIVCQHPGCDHHLTRNEVRHAVQNTPDIMRTYDIAAFNKLNKIVPPPPAPPEPEPAPQPRRPAFVPIDPAMQAAFVANKRAGNCMACREDKPDLQVLGCNHAIFCADCLKYRVSAYIADEREDDDGDAIDQLRCMQPGCVRHMSRDEIGCAVPAEDQRKVLDLYDDTAYERAHPTKTPVHPGEQKEIDAGNLQICPRCDRRTQRIDGCNHITCPCGEHFCWLCGVGWPAAEGYRHFHEGECPLWGRRADGPRLPRAGDIEDEDDDILDAPYAPPFGGGAIRLDLGGGHIIEFDPATGEIREVFE